ncbi:hypothetical protein IZY60_01560 [Lutibacter sp. B2]|nr:hypothetical protein [Lutibacter sp. B2]
MIDKEKLIRHIKDRQDRQIVMKTLNKVEKALKNYMVCSTDFYDPYEISLCSSVLDQISDLNYGVFGGYKEAERKIIMVCPSIFSFEEKDKPIGALKIHGNFTKKDVTHRDFLGAILGLGLKREKIGDLLINDGVINLVVYKELGEYIRLNLDKVSKYKVIVEDMDCKDLIEKEEEFKIIQTTVASLRLDTMASAGFSVSRNIISRSINNEKVKVNFKTVQQSSHMISKQDIISLRGSGRIIVEHIGDKTKKDRIKVTIKRML